MQVVQNIHLARGGTLIVKKRDVMPHQLIKTSGPAMIVKLVAAGMMGMGMMKGPFGTGMMGRTNATLKETFPPRVSTG